MKQLTRADQQAFREWQELCKRIQAATSHVPVETGHQQATRKQKLTADFVSFCKYYLSDFIKSDFGWFHLAAVKAVMADQNAMVALEWPREHAKSVLADIMLPMFLYARGELTGLVLVSQNENKAKGLLSDLQAQFVANQLWINDYGKLAAFGSWSDGYFATTDSIGFWALGRGQSPRGLREGAKRPNVAVVDDIDDAVLVRNTERVKEVVDWIFSDLYFAIDTKQSRLIFAGNRIHKKSVIAHVVGDVEEGDPKREGLVHIKVYALMNKAMTKAASPNDPDCLPAWKENYTVDQIAAKMQKAGYRAAQREFFHNSIEEGNVFSDTWIQWGSMPKRFDALVLYGDPSFKNTKASDHKAWVLAGKVGVRYYIIKAWVRQASIKAMVEWAYDVYDEYGHRCQYWLEANMLQDTFLDAFALEGANRGDALPIRPDKTKKPDKFLRIENETPHFETGFVIFNQAMRKDVDMQRLVSQLLSFPDGPDDGPDAMQGAFDRLRRASKGSKRTRTGKIQRSNSRR